MKDTEKNITMPKLPLLIMFVLMMIVVSRAEGVNNTLSITYSDTGLFVTDGENGEIMTLVRTLTDDVVRTDADNFDVPYYVGDIDGYEYVPLSDGWTQVLFEEPMQLTPVVIAQTAVEMGHVKVKDVSVSGFTFRVEKWSYLNEIVPTASIRWMAIEPGIYEDEQGNTLMEVGMVTVNHRWKTQSLFSSFTEKPIVIAERMTNFGGQPTVVRLKNISESGFQLRLQEEENNDGWHVNEEVGFVAVSSGIKDTDEITIRRLNLSVDLIEDVTHQSRENRPMSADCYDPSLPWYPVVPGDDYDYTSGLCYYPTGIDMPIWDHCMMHDPEGSDGMPGIPIDYSYDPILLEWGCIWTKKVDTAFFSVQTYNGADPITLNTESVSYVLEVGQEAFRRYHISLVEEQSLDDEVAHLPEDVGVLRLWIFSPTPSYAFTGD